MTQQEIEFLKNITIEDVEKFTFNNTGTGKSKKIKRINSILKIFDI